jgi:DNA polymerase-3 subunit beta
MASADGFRLTVVKSDRLNFGLGKRQIIVPKETLALLVRIFTDKPTIAIGWAENKGFDNKVFFKSEGGSVTQVSQLIQGTFPQYEQLIPPSFNSRIAISAPLMAHRLNMIEASEGSGIVKLYTKEEGVLAISHRVEEMYDYEMTIPMKAVGTPIKIAFAYKYLVSALKCFSMCYMETTNPSSPIRITGDIEELTIICMPMFIQW